MAAVGGVVTVEGVAGCGAGSFPRVTGCANLLIMSYSGSQSKSADRFFVAYAMLLLVGIAPCLLRERESVCLCVCVMEREIYNFTHLSSVSVITLSSDVRRALTMITSATIKTTPIIKAMIIATTPPMMAGVSEEA